jgi:hypothetical protein
VPLKSTAHGIIATEHSDAQYKKLLETCESLADALVQCNMLLQHATTSKAHGSEDSHTRTTGSAVAQLQKAPVSPGHEEKSHTPDRQPVSIPAKEPTPSTEAEAVGGKAAAKTDQAPSLHQQLERIVQPVSFFETALQSCVLWLNLLRGKHYTLHTVK